MGAASFSTLLPALVLFSFVSSITPGPNNVMLMTSGVNFGFARSLPHLLGVGVGFTLMVALVGFGLAEAFARVPALLPVLKWVGGAYLVVLAIRIARAGAPEGAASGARPFSFAQAALFQCVNPKAWVMAITACATYTLPGRSIASVLLITAVFGLVTVPCTSAWVGFGLGLRRMLSDPVKLRAFNYTMAALLIASLYPLLEM